MSEKEQSHTLKQQIIELNLEFFNESIKLRCPVENQEKLLIAAKNLNTKFDSLTNTGIDKFQNVLMTCLKYAFHEEIKKDILKTTIKDLKQLRERLSEYNTPTKPKVQKVNVNSSENTTQQTTHKNHLAHNNHQNTPTPSKTLDNNPHANSSKPQPPSSSNTIDSNYHKKELPASHPLDQKPIHSDIDEENYGKFIPASDS